MCNELPPGLHETAHFLVDTAPRDRAASPPPSSSQPCKRCTRYLGKAPFLISPLSNSHLLPQTGIRFLQEQKPCAQKRILEVPVNLPSRSSLPPLEGSVGLHTHKTDILSPDTALCKPIESEDKGEEEGGREETQLWYPCLISLGSSQHAGQCPSSSARYMARSLAPGRSSWKPMLPFKWPDTCLL